MNVFFDVQGTLISGGISRPHVREVFRELDAMGHHIYLWSSAGNGYASQAAELLEIEELIIGCFSKSAPPPVTVDFAVDDQPYPVEQHGGHHVSPFDGDPDDRELWAVVEALR